MISPSAQRPTKSRRAPRLSAASRLLAAAAVLLAGAVGGTARADNVEQLIELLRIRDDIEAQYRECLEGSARSLQAELEHQLDTGELGIEPDDEDWTLLAAIYSEFYNSVCSYLAGDEIVDFYRAEIRKRFSADEIDALIAFHRTPLGRKLSEQWFEINRVYGELLNDRQAIDTFDAQRRFDRRMEEFWIYRDGKALDESRGQNV